MSWSLLTLSTNAGNPAPITVDYEYADAADGDLLIAGGSYDGAGGVTLPGHWTLVTQQQLGNVSQATGVATPSGWLAYMIHDGRTGTEQIKTVETQPGTSFWAAYRHPEGCVFDAAGSETAASSTKQCILSSGLTTSVANCLLVAVGCGSMGGNYVRGYSATDPGEVSGAIDAVTAPSLGVWITRAERSTTASTDSTISFADAIKTSSGPTGPISGTLNGYAHFPVMLAASFRPGATNGRQRSRLILTPW